MQWPAEQNFDHAGHLGVPVSVPDMRSASANLLKSYRGSQEIMGNQPAKNK